jgi:hypothetical protein
MGALGRLLSSRKRRNVLELAMEREEDEIAALLPLSTERHSLSVAEPRAHTEALESTEPTQTAS